MVLVAQVISVNHYKVSILMNQFKKLIFSDSFASPLKHFHGRPLIFFDVYIKKALAKISYMNINTAVYKSCFTMLYYF